MSYPNCHLPEYTDSSVPDVAENASQNESETLPPQPLSLTDDEIADIRRKLSKLTNRRVMNAPDAEDIVQDTLLTMISKPPCAALKKCPLAWSMGILRNKVGNYYRKERRHSSHAVEKSNDSYESHQHSTSLSPERELLCGELFEVITTAVERLPARQRCAMKLLIAGLNPGEIAKRMSSERYQAVINHLYRGRRKIAQELNRYGCGLKNHPGGMYRMKRSNGCRYRKNEDSAARIFHERTPPI